MGICALGWGVVSQSLGYTYIYSISILLAALAGVAYLFLAKKAETKKKDKSKIEAIKENRVIGEEREYVEADLI